jgi:anti-anti-sigma factor
MSQSPSRCCHCQVLVLRVTEARVMGDTVADALRDELLALYGQSGATHVVLDMEEVRDLSSAGIRPLLALNREIKAREGRLVLCKLTPDVEGVFQATRLISTGGSSPATFGCQPDVPAAVASLYR